MRDRERREGARESEEREKESRVTGGGRGAGGEYESRRINSPEQLHTMLAPVRSSWLEGKAAATKSISDPHSIVYNNNYTFLF